MTQRAGRINCPQCGANNFDTVTACWKCSAPLGAAMAAMPATSGRGANMPPMGQAGYAPAAQEMPGRPAASAAYAPYVGYASGDSGVARRAAIALALTIPWIGLPVGWVFMMIEDSRKQAIGRVCAVWSMIALIFHLLIMFVMAQSAGSLLLKTLLPLVDALSKGQGGGGGMSGGGMP